MRRLGPLALVLLAGCGQTEGNPTPDAATADAAADPDAATPDAATPDAAVPDAASAELNPPGKHVHHLTVDGLERETIVYVPVKARFVRAPVLVMFHGTSGDGERFYNISAWREKADAEGLIAVFPSALVHCFFEDENGDGDFEDPGERKVTTKWSGGNIGDELPLCTAEEIAALPPDQQALVDHPLADDVAFFRAMLAAAGEAYAIDAGRVYVSGFSNGGQMTSRLIVEASDLIAAGAAAAGALSVDTVAEHPRPFVFSVGNLDDRFTARVGVSPIPMSETMLTDYPALGLIAVRFLTALQLDDEYTYQETTIGGKKLSRFTASTSLAGAGNVFQYVVIEGLEHQYPNGENHPVSAPDLLWTFFQPYTR
jgi:polyhydroxybutyrate depolymerase